MPITFEDGLEVTVEMLKSQGFVHAGNLQEMPIYARGVEQYLLEPLPNGNFKVFHRAQDYKPKNIKAAPPSVPLEHLANRQ